MTTPDPRGNTEYLGTIEIFGIPFSTFTRTITLGLEELGLTKAHYIQHATEPHDKQVTRLNPFGLLPVLIHRPDAIYTNKDEAVILYESNAIRRYIDEHLTSQANKVLHNKAHLTFAANEATYASAVERAKVDQWVSLASTLLFQAVELGVVKPRLALEKNGADEGSIAVALQQGLDRLHDRLAKFEELFQGAQGDWLCGRQLTWADLYVYPPLADLRAIPEGQIIRGKDAVYPAISAWLDRMEARKSVKSTYDGTLASQRAKSG